MCVTVADQIEEQNNADATGPTRLEPHSIPFSMRWSFRVIRVFLLEFSFLLKMSVNCHSHRVCVYVHWLSITKTNKASYMCLPEM